MNKWIKNITEQEITQIFDDFHLDLATMQERLNALSPFDQHVIL